MAAGLERIFTGWQRPFFELAVPRWIELVRERRLDPSRCVIVVPGRRALRRLEERLAEAAPVDWAPARVVTESGLAAALAEDPLPLANAWQSALAWRGALEATPVGEREGLWRRAEELPLQALARACSRTFAELAAERLDSADIAARAESSEELGPASRWRALQAIFVRYRAALAEHGVVDAAEAAAELLRRGSLRSDLHVQLFGVVDATRVQRELLVRARATSFVFAPAELADSFDELGLLRAESWAERDIAIPLERWHCVERPDDQARAALEHIASLEPAPRPEQVAIGVPDADVLPFLERRLLEAGCEPRWAGGRPLAETRSARFLTAAIAWLARPESDTFAALVRHPDLEVALGAEPGEIARAFDEYLGEHVPQRIDGRWLSAQGGRRGARAAATLERATEGLRELFGELASERTLSSAQWAERIGAMLSQLWPDVDLVRTEPEAWMHARSLEALAQIADEGRAASIGPALAPRELLEILAERIESTQLPPPPAPRGKPVIELLGWLELALDDSEVLVVTGVNEGSLPAPASNDAWLFEAVRRTLELSHERRRVARDAYALSALLASRPEALFVSGRRSSRRDPRVPSRFVFRAPRADVVERVRRAWPEREGERAPPPGAHVPYVPPSAPFEPPKWIPVTAFADYLSSPYAFFVRHVLRLETVPDDPQELDARRFGSLAHDVLERFGRSACANSSDAREVRQFLGTELDALAHIRFGDATRPAVRLQLEKLRARLGAFATWQAAQVAEGWRIHAVEHVVEGVSLDGMELRGRIDRIDHHRERGEWRVLDYKTRDGSLPPRKTHLYGEEWIDLHLPLYRLLTEPLWKPGGRAPELGYVSLDKDEACERWLALPLDDLGYHDALRAAREVIARIRENEFSEVGDEAPFDPSLAALCGFGLAQDEDEDEDEEEGE